MALIRCKECGAQISSLAQSCPSCGCPVAYSLGQQTHLDGNAPAEQFIPPQQEPIPPAPSVPPVPPVPATPPVSGMTDKRKKGILITCICIGVAALLVGGFFLVRTLLDDGKSAVYYPPYSYQSAGKTTYPSGGNGEIPVPSGSEDVTENTSVAVPESTGPVVQVDQLEGSWTGNLMDTVIFEDSQQTTYRYDYDQKSWVMQQLQVREVSADTILLCDTYGNLKSVGYTVSGDGQLLTIDGIIYQKDTNDNYLKPYMMTNPPIFGNLYFGMSKADVLATTNLIYTHEDSSGDVYFKLPLVAEGQSDGFAVCSFDELGRVEGAKLFFYPDSMMIEEYVALQNTILKSCTERFGEATDLESSSHEIYRRWSLREAQIRFSVNEKYIVVSFAAVN